jgi:protein-tyrosine phosphatase
MDDDHLETLHSLNHGLRAEVTIARLLDFATDTDAEEVPDPYYSGGFEAVYAMVLDGCRGLLQHIRDKHHLNGAS